MWGSDHEPPRKSYDNLPVIINLIFQLASTPANIKARFKFTGIYPYNRNAFIEEDFLSSYANGGPAPVTSAAASSGKVVPLGLMQLRTSNNRFPEPHPSSSVRPAPENILPFQKFATMKGTLHNNKEKVQQFWQLGRWRKNCDKWGIPKNRLKKPNHKRCKKQIFDKLERNPNIK
jgi:hypothetical protein